MNLFLPIIKQIAEATNQTFNLTATQTLSGGDINAAYRLQGDHTAYFVKLNQKQFMSMFAAEFSGLEALANSQTLQVPKPIIYGQTPEQAFLVLEFIEFGRATKISDHLFGQQLAALHRQPQAYFGWWCDNTIGSTPQINTPCGNWLTFWREQRLGLQLKLAAQNGYGGKLQAAGERLYSDLDALFNNYQPQPSLLHGDLWSGNAAVDQYGNPIIFDPACYYGDREADLAMTELFGGFSQDFYAAYQDAWTLDQGYATRKTLYNLYHILNHLNLFGGAYLRQAETMLVKLLAEIG
ncbi:MAG: fructosamine kinase family protein [Methylococcaceae bacterium]|nr:fructosamine kinase family protein [Methylococcaceae bacterium]